MDDDPWTSVYGVMERQADGGLYIMLEAIAWHGGRVWAEIYLTRLQLLVYGQPIINDFLNRAVRQFEKVSPI